MNIKDVSQNKLKMHISLPEYNIMLTLKGLTNLIQLLPANVVKLVERVETGTVDVALGVEIKLHQKRRIIWQV